MLNQVWVSRWLGIEPVCETNRVGIAVRRLSHRSAGASDVTEGENRRSGTRLVIWPAIRRDESV